MTDEALNSTHRTSSKRDFYFSNLHVVNCENLLKYVKKMETHQTDIQQDFITDLCQGKCDQKT